MTPEEIVTERNRTSWAISIGHWISGSVIYLDALQPHPAEVRAGHVVQLACRVLQVFVPS